MNHILALFWFGLFCCFGLSLSLSLSLFPSIYLSFFFLSLSLSLSLSPSISLSLSLPLSLSLSLSLSLFIFLFFSLLYDPLPPSLQHNGNAQIPVFGLGRDCAVSFQHGSFRERPCGLDGLKKFLASILPLLLRTALRIASSPSRPSGSCALPRCCRRGRSGDMAVID